MVAAAMEGAAHLIGSTLWLKCPPKDTAKNEEGKGSELKIVWSLDKLFYWATLTQYNIHTFTQLWALYLSGPETRIPNGLDRQKLPIDNRYSNLDLYWIRLRTKGMKRVNEENLM